MRRINVIRLEYNSGSNETWTTHMSPNRPSTSSRSSQNTNLESENECEICGSTDSLSKYSFEPSSGDSSTIVLCPNHYQVAAILSGSRFLDSDTSTDYSLQETKKITVRVPRALIEGADSVAEQEGQTRSEFVRDGIQMAMEKAFNDIISQAVQSQPNSETESDVEFLKERIRKLESLLEDNIDKIQSEISPFRVSAGVSKMAIAIAARPNASIPAAPTGLATSFSRAGLSAAAYATTRPADPLNTLWKLTRQAWTSHGGRCRCRSVRRKGMRSSWQLHRYRGTRGSCTRQQLRVYAGSLRRHRLRTTPSRSPMARVPTGDSRASRTLRQTQRSR